MTTSRHRHRAAIAFVDARVAAGVAALTVALHPQLVTGTPWQFGHDCIEYAVPHALHFFRELGAGRLPLWNPFHDGGAPFLAQPPWMGPFYPAVWLFLLPMGRALDLGFLIHIVSFAIGAFTLARIRGIGRLPAALAALAVGAGTPLTSLARLGYLPEAVALSYLPWVLACLDRGLCGVASRRATMAGAGLCLGLMHLGGHLVASGVVLFATAIYALSLGAAQGGMRGLARALVWVLASEALGFAIAAVTLAPLLASGLESSLSEGRDVSSEYAYLKELWRLGNVLFADFDPSGKGHVFIGVVLLPFIALAGRNRARGGRGVAELWVLLAGTLVLSLGEVTPVWRVLRAIAAPFTIFSYFYFFCVPVALALALLAAHGLDAALDEGNAHGSRTLGAVSLALAMIGAAVLTVSGSGEARTLVRPRLLASLPWMLLGLGTALVAVRWPRACGGVVTVVLLAELAHFAHLQAIPGEPGFSVDRYFDAAELASDLPPPGSGRVVAVERARTARDWALRRNGGMVVGYEDAGRDSKLPLARVAALTDRLATIDVDWVRRLAASKHASASGATPLGLRPEDVDVRILDVLGVTTLVTDLAVEGGAFRIPFRALAAPRRGDAAVRIWERAVSVPRAFLATRWRSVGSAGEAVDGLFDPANDPRALPLVEGVPAPSSDAHASTVRVERRWAPGRVAFETASESPAVLVTGELTAHGWRAIVDGQAVPTAVANAAVLAVPVPAGAHHVEVRYLPDSFVAGASISGCAVVWLGGMAYTARRRARRGVS